MHFVLFFFFSSIGLVYRVVLSVLEFTLNQQADLELRDLSLPLSARIKGVCQHHLAQNL